MQAMQKTLTATLALATLLGASGCIVHEHGYRHGYYDSDHGRPGRIERGPWHRERHWDHDDDRHDDHRWDDRH